MLRITPQMKTLVAIQPVGFHRGIDGLARLCQEVIQHNPFAGAVFVFRNRRAMAVKLLMYDGPGFWLCYDGRATARHANRTGAPYDDMLIEVRAATEEEHAAVLHANALVMVAREDDTHGNPLQDDRGSVGQYGRAVDAGDATVLTV